MAIIPIPDLKARIDGATAPYEESNYKTDMIDVIDTLAALSSSSLQIDPGTADLRDGDNTRVHGLGISVFKTFVRMTDDSAGDYFVEPMVIQVDLNTVIIRWVGDTLGDSTSPPQIYYQGY